MKISRFITASIFAAALQLNVSAATIYNTVPSPLPPGVVSVSEQSNGINRIGDLIQFSSAPLGPFSATLILSDYAFESAYEKLGTSSGFSDLVQLNLYNKNPDGTVGSLLASRSLTTLVPWQPEPGGGCVAPGAYRASDGSCYTGKAFPVTFNFLGVTLPQQVIYGLSFNTTSEGPSPFGVPGPYDALNFGFTNTPPTVGSNPTPLVTYVDFGSGFQPYTGVGLDNYSGMIDFETTPEPSTVVLLSLAGAIVFLKRRTVTRLL